MFKQFTPYFKMGFFIVLAVIGLIFLSYLVLWAFLIGAVFFAIAYIKQKFFTTKAPVKSAETIGRTFDM